MYSNLIRSCIFIFIIINLILFFLQSLNPTLSFYIRKTLSLFPYSYPQFKLWQVFTYAFVHSNFIHILFNMLGIFFLGIHVERTIGFKNTLLIMILTASITGITYAALFNHFNLMGSSAITYGLLVAFTYIAPYQKLFIFGIIPLEARLLTLVLLSFDFFAPILIFTNYMESDGIAHQAHIIGALVSFSFLELKFKRYL